ncbi:hypothetical protein SAY87_000094 [Trapa incisa]|uniref:peroxidase n=1 Tax=Trapa incisa TaxID=236973 RepID=A0AAN7GE13_9MYRT|nr:hypothetical protein SAY87_000094 [Trapa incisa]
MIDLISNCGRQRVVGLTFTHVNFLGGTTWTVQLGRRDSTTASLSAANSDLPSPLNDLSSLITAFSNKGFTAKEMVALSGKKPWGGVTDKYGVIKGRKFVCSGLTNVALMGTH